MYGLNGEKKKKKKKEGKRFICGFALNICFIGKSTVGRNISSRVECVAANIKRYLADKSVPRYRYTRAHPERLFFPFPDVDVSSGNELRYAYAGNYSTVFTIGSTSQAGRSLLTKGRAEGAAPAESSEYAWLCNSRGP